MRRLLASLACLWFSTQPAPADGPADNRPDSVRPVPPPGIEVPVETRQKLEAGLEALGKRIDQVAGQVRGKNQADLLPDVRIFHKAVHDALKYNEFFDSREFALSERLLTEGTARADQLAAGKPAWIHATGLVVRAYESRIDGSIQPYGLVIPPSYRENTPFQHRLDLWAHGRGEKLSELSFLGQRMTSPGEFTPKDTFVLHLYGRYCCANKFAGEVDALEAMADVRKRYPIDKNRVVVRGFSMGGAACWQLAVHYPGLFCAAAPGAGFSETPEFLRVFQNEVINPNAWEKKLLRMYDCTDWVDNLGMVPTVAYSGAKDRQKQAADIMAAAAEKRGLRLTHLIGPDTDHRYHPATRDEINQRVDAIAAIGRPVVPHSVSFTTFSLRYPDCRWIRVTGLESHWSESKVLAAFADIQNLVTIQIKGVTDLVLNFKPGEAPMSVVGQGRIEVRDADGTVSRLVAPGAMSDRSWIVPLHKANGQWVLGPRPAAGLRKVPGLQGPIDDAFLDSFLVVKPTGKPMHPRAHAWAEAERERFAREWRKQFRGEVRVKADTEVTEEDMRKHNLILWGDPGSNAVLAKIAGNLPVGWTAEGVQVGGKSFPGTDHAPALIYPNPLAPARYVVLNSGFTFREYDYLNNARQISRLPDWTVFDLNTKPNARYAGKIAAAGFFDESWKLANEGE